MQKIGYYVVMQRLLLFLAIVSFPLSVYAAEVDVQQVGDGARIEELLNTAISRATTELQGKGTTLHLAYSSPEDLSVIILFTSTAGLFDPLDSLVVTLPAGARQKADIDLTHSTGWTPSTPMYRLHFISTSSEGATFEKVEFTGTSLSDIVSAGFTQLISPLPFTPSSYHRLRSYSVFGIEMIPVMGSFIVFVVLILIVQKKNRVAMLVVVSMTLLLNARFSIDALRYSIAHAREFLVSGTYVTAGSLQQIAEDLRKYDAKGVVLCHTGTSFAERFLQYHVYPIPLNSGFASHIVVHNATDSSYARGVLQCGSDRYSAELVHTYKDSSQLFSIAQQ